MLRFIFVISMMLGSYTNIQQSDPVLLFEASDQRVILEYQLSPDGSQLFIINRDSVKTYDTTTWELTNLSPVEFGYPPAPYTTADQFLKRVYITPTLSQDGTLLVWQHMDQGSDDDLYITDLTTDTTVSLDPTPQEDQTLLRVQVSNTGNIMVYTVRLFTPTEGGGANTYRQYHGTSYSEPFIRHVIYDVKAQQILHTVEIDNGFGTSQLSDDGHWWVLSHGGQPDNATILLYDIQNDEEQVIGATNLNLDAIQTDPLRIVGEHRNQLYQWDAQTGFTPPLPPMPTPFGVDHSSYRLTFIPDTTYLLGRHRCEEHVFVNLNTMQTTELSLPDGACVETLQRTADGTYWFIHQVDGATIQVWSLGELMP